MRNIVKNLGTRSLINRMTEHVRNGKTLEQLYKNYWRIPRKIIEKNYNYITKNNI